MAFCVYEHGPLIVLTNHSMFTMLSDYLEKTHSLTDVKLIGEFVFRVSILENTRYPT